MYVYKARQEERAPKVNVGALASFGVILGVVLIFILMAGTPYKKCCKGTRSKENTPIIRYHRKSEKVEISKSRPKTKPSTPDCPIPPKKLTPNYIKKLGRLTYPCAK